MNKENLSDELKEIIIRGVYIYGCGVVAKRLYRVIETMELEKYIIGFIVSKRHKNDEDTYHGKAIFELDEICNKEVYIVLAVSDAYQNEIISILNEKGYDRVINGYIYSFLNEDHIPEGIPLDVPYDVYMDINELMIMQFVDENFYACDILLSLIDDTVPLASETHINEKKVVIDKNMRIVGGRSYMLRMLKADVKGVDVAQRFDVEAPKYDLQWVKNNYDDNIQYYVEKIIKDKRVQWSKPMMAVIWPAAYDYSNSIIGEFQGNSNCRLGKIWRLTLSKQELERFTRAIYSFDDIEKWKIDRKLNRICINDQNNVTVFSYYLKNPQFRIKRFGHTISENGMRLKNIIREKYIPYIKDYIEDIILHTTDNYTQAEATHNLIEKYENGKGSYCFF